MKLDVGGYGAVGVARRGDDFVTVGIDPTAMIRATMWALPAKDQSVDEIWCSHTLEHAPAIKVPATLKEFYRVLKPGARAIIQVPNFDYVAKYWLTGPDRTWAEQMVFGLQHNEGEFHKCAFTTMILRADCEAAGFEVRRVEMRWAYNQETIQAVCYKPRSQ